MKGEGEIIMKYQEMVSNYELQADSARKLFLTYDQEKMIRRFHLEADAAWIYTEYLHTPCRISRSDGHIEAAADGAYRACSRFHTVMTIYDLLCHAKGETAPVLFGDWCTAAHFAVGSSPQASVFTKKYEAIFAGRAEELKSACERLGGVLLERVAGTDVMCEFAVMLYFPVRLQFWDKDEEFAPRIVVLWDKNAMAFLHFETTYYLQQDLLERLCAQLQDHFR